MSKHDDIEERSLAGLNNAEVSRMGMRVADSCVKAEFW
jgi:hypothetical protein